MIELKFKDGSTVDVKYPIQLKDSHNNTVYCQWGNGEWIKSEYDKIGNRIYFENENGFWYKREYDDDNNQTYYEDSDGKITGISKHNVVEMTMEEVCKAIGKNVKVIK